MKIAIVFVVLLAAACAQDVCKIFSCGSISQTEGETEKCVSLQANSTEVTYDTSTCSNTTQYCQAWEWDMVSQVSDSAVCGNTQYETSWPTQFVASAGMALDGDICNSTADCYTSSTNNATCESSVCKSPVAAGAPCGVTNDCPVGHWCPQDTDVCTVHASDGANCTDVTQCGFRRDCINIVTNGTAATSTCVVWGSLANGDTFTQTVSGPSSGLNADLSGSQVCKSGLQTTISGTIQCRSGSRNVVQGRSSLEKNTAGVSCDTQLFTNDTLEGFANATTATSMSVCGFNKDSKAWCPLLAGDDEVVDFISAFTTVWNTIKCHKNSGASGEASVCKAQQDAEGLDDGWRVYQYIVQTSSDVAFANTANNDRCVAETITSNFWQGQFMSAYTVSAITSMFVFIASIIY
jgi:hypothetical protein